MDRLAHTKRVVFRCQCGHEECDKILYIDGQAVRIGYENPNPNDGGVYIGTEKAARIADILERFAAILAEKE